MRNKHVQILIIIITIGVITFHKVCADASSGYFTFGQLVNSEAKKNELVCMGTIVSSSQYDSLDIRVIQKLAANVERTLGTWYLLKVGKWIIGTESDSLYVFITNLNYGRTRYLFDEKEYMLPKLERDSTYLFFLNKDERASKKYKMKIFNSDVIISNVGAKSAVTIIEHANMKNEYR